MITRRINTKGPQKTDQEENQSVEDSFPDSDELVARAELNISINEVLEEEIVVVNELKKMYDLGEKVEGIIFQKVDFKRLNVVARRVNNVLRFFEASNNTETNNLVVATRQLELKEAKRDGNKKSETW